VLEFLFPLFGVADRVLAVFVPAFIRVFLLSAVVSGLSMLVYALLSPQKRLAAMKRLGARLNRRLMAASDGEFREVLALSRKSLSLNLGRLARTLPGVTVAAVPVVALLLWTWRTYDRQWPPAGTTVEFAVTPAGAAIGPADHIDTNDRGVHRVRLSPSGEPLALVDAAEVVLLTIPPQDGAYAWSRRTASARVFGSPERALPPQATVERIEFRLPPRELLSVGPSWMRGWPVPFLLAATLIPLWVKKVLHIV
jgi:hypothetical protein